VEQLMGFRCDIQRWGLCLALVSVAAGLGGCKTLEAVMGGPPAGAAAVATADPVDLNHVTPNDPLRRGLYHFHRGEFGVAETYFRAVIEKSPENVTAWIGLAGSYDNIRRFDLADRAYQQAIRIAGETAQILNNQGYSYMLRGDFRTARARFLKALRRDPNSKTIRNNLRTVNAKFYRRRQ
jgi:Flp pilus assembly protein TadD